MLLAALQLDPDPDIAIATARGSALDLVTVLAAREILDVIESTHSTAIATAGREILVEHMGSRRVDPDDTLDDVLRHVWGHRETQLGPDRTFFLDAIFGDVSDLDRDATDETEPD